jgi:hypothetical protein
MKLVFGEKIVPKPVEKRNDADNAWGQAWHAWRDGGSFVLEYDSGDIGGHYRRVAISAAEFEQLHAEPDNFLTVVRNHGG